MYTVVVITSAWFLIFEEFSQPALVEGHVTLCELL